MKVLVIGSGGREATLVWKIAQSDRVDKIYAAPGNGGISQHAECVDIAADELEKLAGFAKENSVDLTIVGPENPLADGIVDIFEAEGIRAESHVYVGDPVKEIERAAREHQSTMIVLGSSGKSSFVEKWIGSTPRKIAEDTIYPTLMIPPEKKES